MPTNYVGYSKHNLNELKAINVSDRRNGLTYLVQRDNNQRPSWYCYISSSELAPDNADIILPNDAPITGRWIKVGSSSNTSPPPPPPPEQQLPAHTLYVSPSGTNYTSIVEAVEDAVSGDLIVVFPGNYSLSSTLQINEDINLEFKPGSIVTGNLSSALISIVGGAEDYLTTENDEEYLLTEDGSQLSFVLGDTGEVYLLTEDSEEFLTEDGVQITLEYLESTSSIEKLTSNISGKGVFINEGNGSAIAISSNSDYQIEALKIIGNISSSTDTLYLQAPHIIGNINLISGDLHLKGGYIAGDFHISSNTTSYIDAQKIISFASVVDSPCYISCPTISSALTNLNNVIDVLLVT